MIFVKPMMYEIKEDIEEHVFLPPRFVGMTRSCKKGEFPPCERMFVCHLNLAGKMFYEDPSTFMKICLYVN